MSFTAAALKTMLDKGLTLTDVVEIAAANEVRRDPTAAERMARHREGKRATRNVTRNTPPNESILTPPVLPPKANALVAPTPKKHRLPEDWQPKPFTPGTIAAQTVLRWEPGRMERELSKFRDHYTASGTKWENWQAVWSKWVNNSNDFQRGQHERTSQHRTSHTAEAYRILNSG